MRIVAPIPKQTEMDRKGYFLWVGSSGLDWVGLGWVGLGWTTTLDNPVSHFSAARLISGEEENFKFRLTSNLSGMEGKKEGR